MMFTSIGSQSLTKRVATGCSRRQGISRSRGSTRSSRRKVNIAVVAQAGSDIGAVGYGAIAGGVVANPIMLWSLWTLKATGAGLQGSDLLGAAEGLSYLIVIGIIAWSVYTKISTGSGLPAGPAGLLGAVEGVSYLSLLIGLVVGGLQLVG